MKSSKVMHLVLMLAVIGLASVACQPQIIEVEKEVVVEKVVEKAVEVEVEAAPEIAYVEVEKEVEVEKVVQVEVTRVVEVVPTQVPTTLTVALSAEAESMDPFLVYQQSGGSIMEAVFDTLVAMDYDGSHVPGLAESWNVVDDTTIELILRQGVLFHNGESFNAEAVKFSIERMLDEDFNSALRSNFTSIEEVEVVDDHTVRLHLSSTDGTIFDRLTGLFILPPKYVAEAGDTGVATEPIGTGPFKFVEWIPDDHVTLEANPDYWEGSFKGQPQIGTLIFRPITEASTRIAELIAGGVDMIQDLPPDQIQTLVNAGLVVKSSVTPNLTYFLVTADDPESPFSDVRVRQAINYAVDIQAIIDTLLLGFGAPIASPIGPSNLGYDSGIEPYPYDPDMARSLLEEAGYADGFEITMDVCTCDRNDLALAVAGQLAEVGITVELREIELGQFNDNWIGRAQSEMFRARWGGSPDPNSIELFASCEGWITRYCDEDVTELINAAKGTLSQDERADYYNQASALLHENPVGIYAWANHQLIGVNPRVSGFEPHASLTILPFSVTVGN